MSLTQVNVVELELILLLQLELKSRLVPRKNLRTKLLERSGFLN